MGANNGTGWPFNFFCAICRKRPGWIPTYNVSRTGRTKPYKGGNRGARGLNTFHEYACQDCGHVGWSRHVDVAKRPLAPTVQ